ncbi:cadherin-18-like [Phasianus colchicus]|uniref:cadherin-18-like n=1 Tax=Phasianus colchicus TaxID=9054 RepID=UPI00129DCD7B|nr:cadherin-18-like [Phasianus colchicus]
MAVYVFNDLRRQQYKDDVSVQLGQVVDGLAVEVRDSCWRSLCIRGILGLHSNSDKGDGSVKYILTGEGAGTIFIIDDTTGDIHSTKSLDREQKTHYVLHAQAIDRRTNKPLEPESEFIIKVQDINDNAPKFTDGPYIVTVPEMSEMGKENKLLYSAVFLTKEKKPHAV